jgi:hypothetical protein
MSRSTYRLLVLCLGLVACSQELPADEVGLRSEALGPCNETVPANRNVDGIPAYAQCATIQDGAIFSNNGVDTRATQMGSDWIKTQYSGGYQCTELAHRYLYFKWKVKWIPNGNAGNWCDTQPPASSGLVQTMAPVHGDLMVLAGGSCGAAQSTGHVNVVDTVDMATGRLVAVEQNRAGRSPYMLSCGKCFLHVMANDGVPSPIAAPTPTAAAGAPAAPSPTVPPVDGTAGRPAGRPARAGGGAVPMMPTAAGAAAPVVTPATTAPVAPTAPAVVPAPSLPAAGTHAAGSGALTPQTPAVTRRPAPAADGCSVSGVGPHSVRPSLAIAGLWLFVTAAWSFRRRGKRELARADRSVA